VIDEKSCTSLKMVKSPNQVIIPNHSIHLSRNSESFSYLPRRGKNIDGFSDDAIIMILSYYFLLLFARYYFIRNLR